MMSVSFRVFSSDQVSDRLLPRVVDDNHAVAFNDVLADYVAINELANLLFVGAEIDGFLSILPRH